MIARTMMRRHGSIEPTGAGVVLPAYHPAVRSGRSIFSSRIFDPDEVPRVLKSGHNSRKIGAVVAKGRWRGFPIYTLTLEERATCPRTCLEWSTCYGNNMQAADRVVAGADLETALERELSALQLAHPLGFLVRLHVLGDFYSVAYVDLWRRALETLPALRVFGFTARTPDDPIGAAIAMLTRDHPGRFAMRISGLNAAEHGAVTIAADEDTPHIICPAQLGRTACCATCALCWQTDRTIAFRRH